MVSEIANLPVIQWQAPPGFYPVICFCQKCRDWIRPSFYLFVYKTRGLCSLVCSTHASDTFGTFELINKVSKSLFLSASTNQSDMLFSHSEISVYTTDSREVESGYWRETSLRGGYPDKLVKINYTWMKKPVKMSHLAEQLLASRVSFIRDLVSDRVSRMLNVLVKAIIIVAKIRCLYLNCIRNENWVQALQLHPGATSEHVTPETRTQTHLLT